MKQTTNERTKKQSTSIHISNPIPSLPKLSILRTPSLSFHQKTDDISLKISLKKNYDTSKDQTIKSSREIPAFSSSKEKPIISYRESQLDNSKSQRVSTPELKRNLKILSENEWKTNERSRIKENMRDKSILSALEKSQFQEKPQQKSIEMQQHNISKFYLEYNNSHHPNRPKFLTKNEISDLLGVKTFKLNKDDLQIKEILDNYPNSSFLDLTQLKILDKERNSAGIPNNLTSKFKRLLLKDKESLKTPSMFSSLLETQHKAQNNPEKHPNIRQGVYEMALFLDKISAEIYEKSEERQSPDLDGQIFSIQQACRICIQSLANDISQECNERGILLAKVWDLNMDLMNSYLKKMEKFSTEAEKSFTRNIQSIKQAYKDKLISLEEEIEGLKKKLIKNESNIKETYEDCSFYKEKVIYSERVRKLMESEFQELRSNYENIFLENLKYKLNQSEELNFHRDEKEIFKRTLEEMTRTQVIRKKKGSYISVQQPKLSKAEGLLRKMTSGELNPIALEETTAEFIMQMTNLSYNILDFPKNYEDYISVDYHNPKEIKEISSFFMKEVSVDTTGLHYKEDKEISTKELERSRVREIETQTVLIDEIGEEGIIQKTWSDSMLGSETLYQKKLNPNMNHPLNLSVNTLIRGISS